MFYAITEDQSSLLLHSCNDEDTMVIVAQIGENGNDEFSLFIDKAWDAIHRCLTNGTLEAASEPYPLCKCVLGGVSLHDDDTYIICFVSPEEVKDVTKTIAGISKEWLLNRYLVLDFPEYQYGEKDNDDFEYTWEYFERLKYFYQLAAANDRCMVFTADQ